MKALFDTCILIDHLNAVPEARTEFGRYTEKAISIVTWMEVMGGAHRDHEEATRGFLNVFDVIDADDQIAERAVGLRRTRRIKWPDAIIWATAQTRAMLFVTRDTRDFRIDDPGVRMPYKLQKRVYEGSRVCEIVIRASSCPPGARILQLRLARVTARRSRPPRSSHSVFDPRSGPYGRSRHWARQADAKSTSPAGRPAR